MPSRTAFPERPCVRYIRPEYEVQAKQPRSMICSSSRLRSPSSRAALPIGLTSPLLIAAFTGGSWLSAVLQRDDRPITTLPPYNANPTNHSPRPNPHIPQAVTRATTYSRPTATRILRKVAINPLTSPRPAPCVQHSPLETRPRHIDASAHTTACNAVRGPCPGVACIFIRCVPYSDAINHTGSFLARLDS